MKKLLGIIFMVLGVLGGLYVGGWVMFIQPIIECCKAFDAGMLTATIVGLCIIKCIFASFVGGIIAYAGIFIGNLLLLVDVKHKKCKRK